MKNYFKISLVLLFLFSWTNLNYSQPFTKKYIMSFHICDVNCTGFQDHMVHLAESDDGSNWTLVPNFISYNGSVPDVIIRGDKLYIYTPGVVKRYNNSTNSWDVNPVPVSIVDKNNTPVNFVDPSAIVDDNNNLVLFFLNSTGSTGDPAGCSTYPCTKYFDSAVEVQGSDGTQFVMQDGDRRTILLGNSPQTSSDPDIFYDGSNYILYISNGPNTTAYESSTLHGSYISFPNLQNDLLTNQGGIPSGYFDNTNNQYWTFVHTNNNGSTVVKRAVSSDLNSQLTNFSIVMSGTIIGEPSTTRTESPGFCVNTFLTTAVDLKQNELPVDYKLCQNYPNPFNPSTIIKYQLSKDDLVSLKIYDVLGNQVAQLVNKQQAAGTYEINFDATKLSSGIYFYQLNAGNFNEVKKMILLK